MTKRIISRKPIALDTTLRNPRRFPQFISILSEFEGKVLDDNLTLQLEAELIRQKVYTPKVDTLGTYVRCYSGKFIFEAKDKSSNAEEKVKLYFNEWQESAKGETAREKIVYLLENTITERQDRGWKGGWESRIHTQFNFLNELGLVQVIKNKKVKISEVGHLMIHEYINGYPIRTDYDSSYEESAFLNMFAKYQVNNPYRSNTVEVNIFYLILGVMKELKNYQYDNGLLKKEFAFIITWGNNDYKHLAKLIHRFRQKYGYSASDEIVYSYAMYFMSLDSFENVKLRRASQEFLDLKEKHFKIDKLLYETPDELIRKLRLTMLVTLRGGGRFVDINTLEIEKVENILSNYSINHDFNNTDEYYEYMGEIDNMFMFNRLEVDSKSITDIKNNKISEYSNMLSWKSLERELKVCVSKRGKSNDDSLEYVDKPARFEFLVAVAFRKALPNIKIGANYISDDEGLPFTTASGQSINTSGADIDLFEDTIHALAEPTISNAEAYQVNQEIPSIRRHVFKAFDIDSIENTSIDEWFSLFIAGKIMPDVGNEIKSVKQNSNVDIYPWEVSDFIKFSQSVSSLADYKLIREYSKPRRLG